MFRRNTARTSAKRRAVILLVVLSLLTLFAIVGISFVLYADSEAEASRIFREAQAPVDPDVDPEMALAFFLGQMIYDSDDTTGPSSSLHGHSFARTMYGWNTDPGATNDKPYIGTGRLHGTSGGLGADDYNLINYMYFQGDPVRDPERLGNRATPQTPMNAATSPYTGGWNAPYTYPDLNNVMLAAMNADGKVLAISGHRDYLFNPNGPLNDMTNTNWTNKLGKYMTLRPRPFDHAGFPAPEDAGGDVKNLTGFPGGNDSIWIDMGFPVKTTADGRKFKMLVAPLILDMDGRVNLNAHGNVHGIDQNTQLPTHASNQGFGKTEINLSKVLNADQTATQPPMEWTNLFLGNARTGVLGHYSPLQNPNSNVSVVWTPIPIAFYSGIDIDGCNESAGRGPTGPLQLPQAGPLYSCFPVYPQGYGNGAFAETVNHPLVYNPVNPPPGQNRASVWSELEAIVRHSSTNSPALTSDLQRLCPQNFALARVRNQVTTHGFHVDLPAVTPWVWDPSNSTYAYDSAKRYPVGSPIPFPALGPTPPFGQRNSTPQPSDFDPNTWRSSKTDTDPTSNLPRLLSAAMLKPDTNRRLSDYPNWSSGTRLNLAGGGCCCGGSPILAIQQALAERQQLAQETFAALRAATGTPDPNAVFAKGAPPDPPTGPGSGALAQFQAMRWLAQLAVNIVDYLDEDDIITPFAWFTDSTTGKTHYVYGTELPRLVINETYVELQDPTPTTGNNYSVNFWLELLNPLQNDPNIAVNGRARLNMPADPPPPFPPVNPAYPVYQICINQKTAAAGVPYIVQPWNTAGDPDPATIQTVVSDYSAASLSPPMTVLAGADPDAPNIVEPLGPAFSGQFGLNQGFFVIGPSGQTFQGAANDPTVPIPTLTVPSVPAGPTTKASGLVVNSGIPANTDLPLIPTQVPDYTITLRRLAYPSIPPNPTPGPLYNPYITIDYVDTVQIKGKLNDGVKTRTAKSGATPAIETRQALGRRQPYSAEINQLVPQLPNANPPLKGQPQTTFFRHNSTEPQSAGPPAKPDATDATLKLPFDWLVHLDRPLLSPVELLHVSGVKPQELTQQFMAPNQPFGHRAPWYDQSTLIYRFLEFMETRDRAVGSVRGGRIPGRININTVWGVETFRALCDAQPSNYFTESATGSDDVNRVFQDLITSRSPNGTVGPTDQTLVSVTAPLNKPLLPLSTGYSLASSNDGQHFSDIGINNTYLRLGPLGNQPLFDPQVQTSLPTYGNAPTYNHPYVQKALLNKIFNNLTTRSNVFAVWMTVGFFEVIDDKTQPVKLGAEIGRSENRHIRHRMFAIVDRSNLTTFTTQVINPLGILQSTSPQPLNGIMQVSGIDTRTGRTWQLQPGTILNFDQADIGFETNDFEENVVVLPDMTAVFTRGHNPGAKILGYANPGPWTRYDPRQDTTVVPYFSIID